MNKIGVFDPAKPLRFEAFDVRYFGRNELPSRAVIDLSRNDDVIHLPQHYFAAPHVRNRHKKKEIDFLPTPTYNAHGGLRQGQGHAAQSLAYTRNCEFGGV
jgi:hypothetical protein